MDIQSFKVKFELDNVLQEKNIMITSKQVTGTFIDSYENRSTCLKSSQVQKKTNLTQEWSYTYHEETLKMIIKMTSTQKVFDINFNETNLLLC